MAAHRIMPALFVVLLFSSAGSAQGPAESQITIQYPARLSTVSLALRSTATGWQGPLLVIEMPLPSAVATTSRPAIRGNFGSYAGAWGASGSAGGTWYSSSFRTGGTPPAAVNMAESYIETPDGKWRRSPLSVSIVPASATSSLMRLTFPVPPHADTVNLHVTFNTAAFIDPSKIYTWTITVGPLSEGIEVVPQPPNLSRLRRPLVPRLTCTSIRTITAPDLLDAWQKRTAELRSKYKRVHAIVAPHRMHGARLTRVVLEGSARHQACFLGVPGGRLNQQKPVAWAWALQPRSPADASPLLVELWFPTEAEPEGNMLTLQLLLCDPDAATSGPAAAIEFKSIPIPSRSPTG